MWKGERHNVWQGERNARRKTGERDGRGGEVKTGEGWKQAG